jgi:hypothetical protein
MPIWHFTRTVIFLAVFERYHKQSFLFKGKPIHPSREVSMQQYSGWQISILMLWLKTVGFCAIMIFGLAFDAWAQKGTVTTDIADLKAQIEALSARIDTLETEQEGYEVPPPPQDPIGNLVGGDPVSVGDALRVFIEMDFFGAGGTTRLRHGFGQAGSVIAGHTYMVYANGFVFPDPDRRHNGPKRRHLHQYLQIQ